MPAPSVPPQQFRFLDLPREIRNKVYRNMLCSFAPASTTTMPPMHDEDFDFSNSLALAQRDNKTSILRVSRQIHREAYNVMVKTNRFVRVTSSGGFPLKTLLNHLQVPVVAEDKQSNQFNRSCSEASTLRGYDGLGCRVNGKEMYHEGPLGERIHVDAESDAEGETLLPDGNADSIDE